MDFRIGVSYGAIAVYEYLLHNIHSVHEAVDFSMTSKRRSWTELLSSRECEFVCRATVRRRSRSRLRNEQYATRTVKTNVTRNRDRYVQSCDFKSAENHRDESKQEKERRSLGGVPLTYARSAGSFRLLKGRS